MTTLLQRPEVFRRARYTTPVEQAPRARAMLSSLLADHFEPLSEGSGFQGQGHFGSLTRAYGLVGYHAAPESPIQISRSPCGLSIDRGQAHAPALEGR